MNKDPDWIDPSDKGSFIQKWQKVVPTRPLAS